MQNPGTIALLKTFLAAFGVSFLGSIPIGTISATTLQLSISGLTSNAFLFASATVLVEMALVLLLLTKFRFLNDGDPIAKHFYPVAILFISVLGLLTFNEGPDPGQKAALVPGSEYAFLMGIIIGVLNPLQIPYWLVANRFFYRKGLVSDHMSSYGSYILAIGAGSLLVLFIYIQFGTVVANYHNRYGHLLHKLFGLLYLGIALYLTYCYYYKYLKTKTTNV